MPCRVSWFGDGRENMVSMERYRKKEVNQVSNYYHYYYWLLWEPERTCF